MKSSLISFLRVYFDFYWASCPNKLSIKKTTTKRSATETQQQYHSIHSIHSRTSENYFDVFCLLAHITAFYFFFCYWCIIYPKGSIFWGLKTYLNIQVRDSYYFFDSNAFFPGKNHRMRQEKFPSTTETVQSILPLPIFKIYPNSIK